MSQKNSILRLNSILWIAPFFSFVFGYYITHNFFHTKQILSPNIVGKTIQEAVRQASSLGLNIRLFREKLDSDLPDGIVLDQIPKQNNPTKPNQHIFVTLSKRPKGVLAPELVELNQKSIAQRCKEFGVQNRTFWLESFYPKNFCMAQSPSSGSVLEKESIITYFSSGKNKWIVFPNLRGESVEKVKKFLEEEGVRVEIVRKNDSKNDVENNLKILDQKPMAGSIVNGGKKLYVQLQVG